MICNVCCCTNACFQLFITISLGIKRNKEQHLKSGFQKVKKKPTKRVCLQFETN